jgi:hypothetical protein
MGDPFTSSQIHGWRDRKKYTENPSEIYPHRLAISESITKGHSTGSFLNLIRSA